MMQTPVIVTFANQKGGVGKTTLCVTFANYLVTKGVRVLIVDCDFQHSILKCRRSDLRKYGTGTVPYDVVEKEATDRDEMTALMETLHNEPSIEVALVDSPGSLKAPGLVPLFVNSDIIVIPFHYDLVTVPSTASFIMFLDRLKQAMAGGMKSRLFMVPNMSDGRVGKRAELVIWDKSRETFSNYGEVTPKLSKRADMERFSTIAALDMQTAIVSPVFDKIYYAMFDTTNPLRQPNLRGIQLVENLEHKKKKAKAVNPPVQEPESDSSSDSTSSTDIPEPTDQSYKQ
ncbi:ParA family protein [Bacteroides acidifaciens]|uniref:ParA family protein n=1 Tax=Bacteroidales TaxID=171549 RepID=UPI0025ADAC9E|nr:ParA family protein [Bacteroides acidifaciens]